MFDLKGKTALVTGSSRGIGRAILLAYARQGADVILHCRKPDARADETLALARETGVKVYSVFGDLSQKDAPAEMHREIKSMGLNVDILVLNASVELRRHWTEISDEEYDLQLNTNLRSPMKLMQLFIPEMQQRGWATLPERRPCATWPKVWRPRWQGMGLPSTIFLPAPSIRIGTIRLCPTRPIGSMSAP